MSGPVYDDLISGYRRPTTPAPVCQWCNGPMRYNGKTWACPNGCNDVTQRWPGPDEPVCMLCGDHDHPHYCTPPFCGDRFAKLESQPLKESLDDIAGALVDTLMRKNTDYGDSYRRLRDEFGPDSFLIRLGDKYNRLVALRGKEALVSETTDDTIRDIAGYCLLEMAYRKEAE